MTDWIGVGTISTSGTGLGTVSRATLRRDICRELHMPFIRRTGTGYSTVDASPAPTTTSFGDDALAQEDDHWNGQWYYNATNGDVRKIVDFRSRDNSVLFEYAATLPVSGDTYEIHSIWNAHELHAAINRAIEDAFPSFFDYVTDETLIFKSKTLNYALSSLTYAPWVMSKIWAEHNNTKITGTATAGASGSITDSAAKFGSVEAGWLVSIYEGTGIGQLRTVSSATSTVISVSASWTTTPDTTSKYAVWNPDEQTAFWEPVLSVGFDRKEFPTYIYLQKDFPNSLGMRIRLEYSHKPEAMTAETSVTNIPKEFIINKALSVLFGQKVNDNRADRNRFANLEEYRRQLAEQDMAFRAFQQPDSTIWQSSKSLLSYNNSENPF